MVDLIAVAIDNASNIKTALQSCLKKSEANIYDDHISVEKENSLHEL